jgi:hypothetical protein
MRKTRTFLGALLLAAPMALMMPGVAFSAPPPAEIHSGDHDTLRAIFYEHANKGGATLTYWGGSNCTTTTADADFSRSAMPAGWNDVISSWADFNSCDVKFYPHVGFGGTPTAYLNAGRGGRNMPAGFNDVTSSFRVS